MSALSQYHRGLPGPEDVLPVVGVSATSLDCDRQVDGPLCGRRGSPEARVADLNGQALTAYREPSSGDHQRRFTFRPRDWAVPAAVPDPGLNVGWLSD